MKLTPTQLKMWRRIRSGTFEAWMEATRLMGVYATIGANNTLDSLCRKKLVRYDHEQKKWVVTA